MSTVPVSAADPISPLLTAGQANVVHAHRPIEDPEGYVFPSSKLQPCPAGKRPVVLLACGSYSPITFMHMRLFEMGRETINLGPTDEYVVGGFISPVSDAYGKKGLVSGPHRLEMCKLAFSSSQFVSVDPWEAMQPKYRYTMEVINHLLQHLNKDPSKPKVEVKLLCGSDLLDSFNTPGVWAEADIDSICSHGIVCLERAGTDINSLVFNNDTLFKWRNNITVVRQTIRNDISSTAIRQCLRRGMSIKYLVPDDVEAYIDKHKLYSRI